MFDTVSFYSFPISSKKYFFNCLQQSTQAIYRSNKYIPVSTQFSSCQLGVQYVLDLPSHLYSIGCFNVIDAEKPDTIHHHSNAVTLSVWHQFGPQMGLIGWDILEMMASSI